MLDRSMLYTSGMIVGIDEVGRGPWAGPLVFGAVILGDASIEGLTDSKKLSKMRREALDVDIRAHATSVSLGWVSAAELDSIGLSQALTLACRRALEGIDATYTQIIIDGTVNFLKATGKGPYVTTLAKADLLIPSVSAASIVAKVARDNFMTEQDSIYPGYGFASHVGYGTSAHRAAIEQYGVTPLHRHSFAPIAAYTASSSASQSLKKSDLQTTTSVGSLGEDVATRFLQKDHYTILERNWKTKSCEIDIIARKGSVIYFVEVKYRKKRDQGGGMAAITPTKLRQMDRAARTWMQRHGLHESRLSVIEVSGPEFGVTAFLEQV